MSVFGTKGGTLGVAFGVNNDGFFSIIPLCMESFFSNDWEFLTLKIFQNMMEYYMTRGK
jgi:hypothetical protein